MAAQASTVSALGRALVQQGRLVQADANAIQVEAAKAGVSFIQQLVQVKKLSAKEVSLFAAQTFGYPLLDLNAVDVDSLPVNLIDNKLVTTHRVVALAKRGNRVFVAMSDPANEQVLHEVKFATGHSLEHPAAEADPALGDFVQPAGVEPSSTYRRYVEHEDPPGATGRVGLDQQFLLGQRRCHREAAFLPPRIEECLAPDLHRGPAIRG